MSAKSSLAGLIDPRPRQLERYAEDFERLLVRHHQLTAQLERTKLESQRSGHLQRQLNTLQHDLAEPVASLELIARILLTRTGGDGMSRDLAATVLETAATLQAILARSHDTTLEVGAAVALAPPTA